MKQKYLVWALVALAVFVAFDCWRGMNGKKMYLPWLAYKPTYDKPAPGRSSPPATVRAGLAPDTNRVGSMN